MSAFEFRSPAFTVRWNQWLLVFSASQLAFVYLLSWAEGGSYGASLQLVLLLAYLLSSLLVATSIYLDASRVETESGWPLLRGFFYMVPSVLPLANQAAVAVYLLNKKNITDVGRPAVGFVNVTRFIHDPRGSLTSLYRGTGVTVSIFLVLFILMFMPYTLVFPVSGSDSSLSGILVGSICFAILGVLIIRGYAGRRRRQILDFAVRDLTVRVAPVLGFLVLATALLFPAAIFAFILALPVTLLHQELGASLGLGFGYALFVLPLSMALTLLVRSLPWINAVPFVLKSLLERTTGFLHDHRPGAPSRIDTDSSSFIPIRGHNHTNVRINTDVDMSGIYGYEPRPIDAIDLHDLPYSRRRGLRLFLPVYLYTGLVIAFFQFRPTQAAALASGLPAENALLIGASSIGIPRTVVVGIINAAGLDPAVISMGFVGGILPAVLMIPAAWHFSLEYEALMYRMLKRRSGEHHHLLLWTLQFVSPLLLLYCWWKNRGQ